MSFFVIVFLSCVMENNEISCDIDYSKRIYKSKEQCEFESQLHLIRGECVELRRD